MGSNGIETEESAKVIWEHTYVALGDPLSKWCKYDFTH